MPSIRWVFFDGNIRKATGREAIETPDQVTSPWPVFRQMHAWEDPTGGQLNKIKNKL